jgi:cytochrome c-type biogenesis protein CcmH/NrfG
MRSESIVFALAGVAFGLIAGWVIGSQQTAPRAPAAPAQASAAEPAAETAGTRATLLDEAQVTALKSVAGREPSNARPRAQLGNLYFDAERYGEAIQWYGEAVKLAPSDVNISTDLGICYYYTNQPDKALEQFEHSLQLDPNHAKTLLNVGIVRAFGKQDLDGAVQAWQQVMKLSPNSPEGQAAKRALDSLQSAHRGIGGTQKPGA